MTTVQSDIDRNHRVKNTRALMAAILYRDTQGFGESEYRVERAVQLAEALYEETFDQMLDEEYEL